MFKVLLSILLTASILCGQTVVLVDVGQDVGVMKDLRGANKGPQPYHVQGFLDVGFTLIRMHDYHGANDYPYYTDFWQFDESSHEFGAANPNFDPNDPAHYDWNDFDKKILRILNLDMEPYVRLGISYPNPSYVIQPNDPPLDPDGIHFTRFAQLAKRTVMHYNDGWDQGYYYGLRYWEIWNEPDGLFWSGTHEQFYELFAAVADTLHQYNPDLMVGGPGVTPATTIGVNPKYLDNFLEYLHNHNVSLDFYSWHVYGIHNPYMLGEFARNIRQKLDEYGFTEAESHISEINHNLKEETYLNDSAKGATFYASLLIAAQKSPVDRLMWYPGDIFFKDDSAGQGNLNWGAFPLKIFTWMLQNTPVQIATTGDVVVDDFWDVDTTNFMSLAARSENGSLISILVSNYNSDISDYSIAIENHFWQIGDTLSLTGQISREPSDRFKEFTQTLVVSDPLEIDVKNMPAPSVLFLKIEKQNPTGVALQPEIMPKGSSLYLNYPNPFNAQTAIHYTVKGGNPWVRLTVFNTQGQEIVKLVNQRQKAGEYRVVFDGQNLPSGMYFCLLQVGQSFQQIRRMLLIR